MLNLVSIVIGVIGLALGLLAFLPLLGWANWFLLPIPIVGAAIGMLSRGTAGRNLNLFVIVLMVLRLFLGGGLF